MAWSSLQKVNFALLLWLVAFLYWVSLGDTIGDLDAAEFAVVGVNGGIAHAPGYPFYSALLRLAHFLWTPLGVVRSLSLVSLLANVMGCALMVLTLVRLGYSFFSAGLAALVTYTSAIVWRAGTSIEPFGLNLFLCCLMLHCCVLGMQGPSARARRFALAGMGLTFGLSACNHHSFVFLIPGALWCLARIPLPRSARGTWFALGFGAGLLPLFYFLLERFNPIYVVGDWSEFWPQLLHHMLRVSYGTFALRSEDGGSFWSGPALSMFHSAMGFSLVFFLLPFVAWFQVPRTRRRERPVLQDFWRIIFMGVLGTGLVFPALFRSGFDADAVWIQMRFFALPSLLFGYGLAPGFDFVASRIRVPRIGYALGLLTAFHLWFQWSLAERRSETFFEDHIHNMFALLGREGVLVTHSDVDYFGYLYGRHVLHLGSETDNIQIGLVNSPWYQKHLEKSFPDLGPTSAIPLAKIINHLAHRRPIFSASSDAEFLGESLEFSYPLGPLIRLLAPGIQVPSPREVFAMNGSALKQTLKLPSKTEIDSLKPWEASIISNYARPWRSLEPVLRAAGQLAEAETCNLLVQELEPRRDHWFLY